MSGLLAAVWKYRYFIISSVKVEFKSRFVRSRLGGLWMLIHPLAQVAIYSLILSNLLSSKLPGVNNQYSYAIYLMAGTLGWQLFVEILSRLITVFIENANILKKITFPKIALPLIIAGSAMVNYSLLFAAIIVIFTLLGHYPTLYMLWLIPITAIVIAFSSGLGLILGVLNVFIRDIAQAVTVILQFLFWLTPIVYVPKVIPEKYLFWLSFNPLYHIINAYHDVMVFRHAPDIAAIAKVAAVSLILMALAIALFRRANEEIVDML